MSSSKLAFAFYKMAELSVGDVESVWKMLDELATSDPIGYQKFISEQMKVGSVLLSRPRCRCIQKCTLKVLLIICDF